MSWWNEPTSKHAFTLSWISVLVEGAAAVGGLFFFATTGSALSLVFGLENCVDVLSSLVVTWRFYCPGEITKEREDLLLKREKRASMAISFILMLLGIGVIVAAADDISKGPEGKSELKDVLIIASFSIFVFGFLSSVKFRYAEKLSSASLYKDGICSVIGTVLAIGLFITTLIIKKVPSVWWLDPVFAMTCGLVALVLGAQAIIVASCIQGLPIFTAQWWFVSQGDGMDEMGGGEQKAAEMPSSASKSDDTKLSEVV